MASQTELTRDKTMEATAKNRDAEYDDSEPADEFYYCKEYEPVRKTDSDATEAVTSDEDDTTAEGKGFLEKKEDEKEKENEDEAELEVEEAKNVNTEEDDESESNQKEETSPEDANPAE